MLDHLPLIVLHYVHVYYNSMKVIPREGERKREKGGQGGGAREGQSKGGRRKG